MSTAAEEIRALVIAYAERLDAGDLAGVAALFSDGRFRSGRDGSIRVGTQEVRAMYDPVILYQDGTPRTKHVLGNLSIDVDEAHGAANASCTFTVVQASPEHGPRPVLAGRYVDTFRRGDDAQWRFEERTVVPELMGDLAQHMRSR
jgi:ketosteroid isomerase-like protein